MRLSECSPSSFPLRRFRIVASVALLVAIVALTPRAWSQSGNVVVSSSTSWATNTYQLTSLTVNSGATLTIGGGSTVNVSGTVLVTANSAIVLQSKNNASLVGGTWQGVGVTINAASLQVDAGSSINADGQGYIAGALNCSTPGAGPGGGPVYCNNAGNAGSYGGLGGGPTTASVSTYGSQFAPVDLGSGGSAGACGVQGCQNQPAGAGGGAVRLVITGTMTLNGTISANGGNAESSGVYPSGAGSGGSVYVTAGTLAGSGTFSANGGAGVYGGGGGRVAVYYTSAANYSGFNASVANGSANGGQNGTVLFANDSQANPDLNITNLFFISAGTTATFNSITVNNGGTLTIGGGSNITVTNGILVTGNSAIVLQSQNNAALVSGKWQGAGVTINAASVQVDAGSSINADGQGYVAGALNCSTPGAGPGGGPVYCNNAGNGGSYAGLGAGPSTASVSTYGSQFAPVDLGSGGSAGACGVQGCQNQPAGAGGGAMRLVITGTMTINGVVSANGGNAESSNVYPSGAGAGGSVYITVGTLAGSGIFSANGGTGIYGGGGGRVAVYYTSSTFSGSPVATANGGTSSSTNPGQPGTVVLIDNSVPNGRLHIDQSFVINSGTTATYNSITVSGKGVLTIGAGSDITVLNTLLVTGTGQVIVQSLNNTAKIHSLWQGQGGTLSVGNLEVDAGASLNADGQGYIAGAVNCSSAGAGPGGGPLFCNNAGNAGSYGGLGAGSQVSPGATYGSQIAPMDLGSGGSAGACGVQGCQNQPAGAGGGTLRLVVTGTLTLNGTISANGGNAESSNVYPSGAGAGGSVYVTAGTLAGSGTFSANGGAGVYGGGGGRVAVYYTTNSGSTTQTATGGTGSNPGHSGSVVFSQTSQPVVWLQPIANVIHATTHFEGSGMGLNSSTATVNIVAVSNAGSYTLATGLPTIFAFDWNTTAVPDGQYEIHLTFRDGSGNVIEDASRTIAVNNTAIWQTGVIGSSGTWVNTAVNILQGNVIIPSGVTVTVQPGTILKAMPGAQLVVEAGGILNAQGTAQAPIVFTTITDDSVGGDTDYDSGAAAAQPGDWSGIVTFGNGQANVNSNTSVDYSLTTLGGTLTANLTLFSTVVYHVTGNITVPSGITLTLQPGAIVKFDPNLGISVQGGQLIASGTVPQPIYFTSIKDDSIGGDTNGDGNATTPAAGDWGQIEINGGTGTFNHVVVSYGGGPTTAPTGSVLSIIRADGAATLTISNSVVQQSFFDGIIVNTSTTPTISNTIVSATERAIFSYNTVNVINCTLDNNQIGLFNHAASMNIANTIVSNSIQSGVQGPGTFTLQYSDIWTSVANAVNYSATSDLTGQSGNISANPKYINAAQGNYRLNYGSPAIDAANSPLAPTTDEMGDPRYNDPRTSPKTGIPNSSVKYADMGALEFVESAPSDIDLTVSSVTGPATAMTGTNVQIQWADTNTGTAPAVGPWHDAIYLVRNPDTNPVAIFMGTVLVASGVTLGPGQTYNASATFRVPGSIVGNHHWEAKVNVAGDVFVGQNTADNTGVSLDTVYIDLPQITLDAAAVTNAFASAGQSWWYKLTPGSNKSVGVSASLPGNGGTMQLFIGQGYVPSQQQYDEQSAQFNSSSANAVISNTTSQTYYVTAYSPTLTTTPENFSIAAATEQFSLTSVSPGTVDLDGAFTLEFIGSGFNTSGVFTITPPTNTTGATAVTASSIFVQDPSHVFASFAQLASNYPQGSYSAAVTQNSATASLANAFKVAAGTDPPPGSNPIACGSTNCPAPYSQLDFSIVAPPSVRAGFPFTITVNYSNPWGINMPAPLFWVTATGGQVIPPAPTCPTCTPTYQAKYQQIYTSGNYLAINFNGPAGVLPPGAQGSITFTAIAGISSSNVQFNIVTATDLNTPANFSESALKPFYEPTDAWDPIYNNFIAAVGNPTGGPTMGLYNALLDADASYLSQFGEYIYQVDTLFEYELLKAGLKQITKRYHVGAYGRGSTHPYDIWAEIQNGGPVIHYPDGGVRAFVADANIANQYDGFPGDNATITLNSSDQSWLLTEVTGGKTHLVVDPTGLTNRWVLDYFLDLNGNQMSAHYTGDHLTSVVNSTTGDTTSFVYNSQGLITSSTDPVGRQTTYAYDSAGQHLLSTTNAGGTTTYTYVTGQGNAEEYALASVAYPDGTHDYFTYDTNGRLTSRYMDANAATVTYAYDTNGVITATDAAGNSSKTYPDVTGHFVKAIDPLGSVVQASYDSEGKLISTLEPTGAFASFSYDALGNVTAIRDKLGHELDMNYASRARLSSLTDALGNAEQFAYDSRANRTATTFPDNSAQNATYDAHGNLVDWTNRRNSSMTFTYDSHNLLTQVNHSNGAQETFTYDTHRNLLTATSAAGTNQNTYDTADRLTKVTYPDGHSLQFTYDAGGRRATMTDPSSFTVQYAYDAVGRLSSLTSGGTTQVTYAYDAVGRLTQKTLGNGTYTKYTYDAAERVTGLVNYAANGSVLSSFTYIYDALGRKTSVTTLQGTTNFQYDDDDQLVSLSGTTSTASYSYDAAGNRVTAGSGLGTTYAVNNLNEYTSAGSASYIYDADGNMTGKTDSTGTSTYAYDDENRLTGVTGPAGTWTYTYDAFGNRIAQVFNGTRTDYLIDPAGIGEVVAEFAGSGSLIGHYVYGSELIGGVPGSGGATYYAFDATGNTAQVTNASGAVVDSYSFLPFGEKTVNSQAVVNPFTFGGQFGVMDEGTGLYFMRHRWYDPTTGRFTQPDPLSYGAGDANLYRYAGNNPLNSVDPAGLDPPVSNDPVTAVFGSDAGWCGSHAGAADANQIADQIAQAKTLGFDYMAVSANGPGGGTTYYINLHNGNRYGSGEFVAGTPGASVTFMRIDSNSSDRAGLTDGFLTGSSQSVTIGANGAVFSSVGSSGLNASGGGFGTPGFSAASGYGVAVPSNGNSDSSGSSGCPVPPPPPPPPAPGGPGGAGSGSVTISNKKGTDPNGKMSGGFGNQGFVPAGSPIPYTIYFENQPTATAPAVSVVVTDPLSANLDWSTMRLTQIAFNNVTINVPSGLQTYSTQATVSTDSNPVQVNAAFNTTTGALTWTMQSINSTTGSLVTDPSAGFLPPDNASLSGDGFVSFMVTPKSGLSNGTVITNQASIVFDANAAIPTNTVTNTIDSVLPASSVTALPATTTTTSFPVNWSGADPSGSGIAYFDVYASLDSGSFGLWQAATASTSATYTGVFGHTYAFYSMATNNIGTRQLVAGTTQSTRLVLSYTVTPSAGTGGSISPNTAQVIAANGTTSFTVTANSGYLIASVTGCGGTLVSSTYTTGAITANCAVTASFTAIAPIAALTPSTLTFTAISGTASTAQSATLSNTGNAALSISGITITGTNSGSFGQTNNCGSSLAAGSNCAIAITFNPASTGTFAATLSVANNASGSPQTVSLNGTGTAVPTYTIAGTAVTVARGATTGNASTVTVTPTGGFTGSITLTAAITSSPTGAQFQPTLNFGSTSPVSITGTTAGTATLTISTTAATSSTLVYPRHSDVPWYAAGGGTLACLLLFGIPGQRRRWRTMLGMLLFLVALSVGVSACGGGSSGGGGTSSPGTTAGTYTVTVTGTSGTTTANGTVTVTVQ